MARCIENYTIEVVPYECPPPENITCANGKDPVSVHDARSCCPYQACDCKPQLLNLRCIAYLFTYPVYFSSESFLFTFQVSVKDGVIHITKHLTDFTTLIKGTVHIS